METDAVVGKRVEELRTEAGLSQEDLSVRLRAAGLNWSQGTLSRVETGSRPMRFVEALTVAGALGVEVADLTPFGSGLTYAYHRRLETIDGCRWAVSGAKADLHIAEVSAQIFKFAIELTQGTKRSYVLHIPPEEVLGHLSYQLQAGSSEKVLVMLGGDAAVINTRMQGIDSIVDEKMTQHPDNALTDEDVDEIRGNLEFDTRQEILGELFRGPVSTVEYGLPARCFRCHGPVSQSSG